MKLQFIKKYSGRVYEGTIHFRIAFKKKKNRTQRKSIINKREENKEEFAKDRT